MKTEEASTAWGASETPRNGVDFALFRNHGSTFALINIAVIAVLLLSHTVFLPYVGSLTLPIALTLSVALVVKAAEFAWLRSQTTVSERTEKAVACWSIGFNAVLTFVLMLLTRGEDSQSFILMAVPLIEAASVFNLPNTVGVIVLANFLNFFEAMSLDSMDEYLEAGATSLIYTFVGILVWLLVNNLRGQQDRLKRNISELEHTRERLLNEEKLAAVGRLSSAIAHEIRNPVTMIASSLEAANRPGQDESARQEMFAIAGKEAGRLERLTTDFLVYARPQALKIARANVSDSLNYIAAVARSHAQNKGVTIEVASPAEIDAEFDATQIHQALLNLVLNAIDACNAGDKVRLAARCERGNVVIDVCDPCGPIPLETTTHLFEPFFTTKSGGTGLGLAIARNVARGHLGDLVLSKNFPTMVCFSIEIPAVSIPLLASVELENDQNLNR